MLFYPSKIISIYAVWKTMEVCLSVSLSFCLFVFFYFSMLVLVFSCRTLDVVLSEQSYLYLCSLEDYGGLFVYLPLCLSVSLSLCLSILVLVFFGRTLDVALS
jgi:hypothetical protein